MTHLWNYNEVDSPTVSESGNWNITTKGPVLEVAIGVLSRCDGLTGLWVLFHKMTADRKIKEMAMDREMSIKRNDDCRNDEYKNIIEEYIGIGMELKVVIHWQLYGADSYMEQTVMYRIQSSTSCTTALGFH